MTGIDVAEMVDRGDLDGLGRALRNALAQIDLMKVQMRTHAGDTLSLQNEIDALRDQDTFPSPEQVESLCQRIYLMAFDCHTMRLLDIRNKLAAAEGKPENNEAPINKGVLAGIEAALDQLSADRTAILKDVTHAMWAHQVAGTLYLAKAAGMIRT